MEITGKIKTIGNIKEFDNNFRVQEIILDITQYNQTTGEKYENYIKVQVSKSKPFETLGNCKVDDIIKVDFNINGRFFVKKDTGEEIFMQNLDCWRIEKK